MPGNSYKPFSNHAEEEHRLRKRERALFDEHYRATESAEEERLRKQAYHIINNQLKIEFESTEKGKRRERLRSVIEDIQKKRVEVDELNNKRRKLQFQLIHLQSVKDTIVNLMIPDEPPVASSPAPLCESQIPGSPVPTVLEEGSQTSSPSFYSRLNSCTSLIS